MAKLNQRHAVSTALAAALLIFMGIGILAYRNTLQLLEAHHSVSHTYQVIDSLSDLLLSIKNAESATRGYMLSGRKNFMEFYADDLAAVSADLARVRGLIGDNPNQMQRLKQLTPLIAEKITWMTESVRAYDTSGLQTALWRGRNGTGKKLMGNITRLIGEMKTTERDLLAARKVESNIRTRRAIFMVGLGGAFAIGLFLLVFSMLDNEIRRRLKAEARMQRLVVNLRHHTNELTSVNKELEAFSYSVSHDLRAPLRHISGFAELLRTDPGNHLSDSSHRFIRTILEASKQMGRLIDDLLAFSRMGRTDLKKSLVRLNPLIDQIRADLLSDIGERRIDWDIHRLPDVQADPAMMRQVFFNLISNAIKYTRPRERASIEIGAHPDVTLGTIFFVRDNGVGFDMKYADQLFGVFQRLHSSDDFEGTGIGLANVRRILHRHGGKTWAESTLDQGASFYFSLPS